MADEPNDSESVEPVFEPVHSDGPAPMEGIISVADGTPTSEPATPGLEVGEEDNKGSYTWVIENFSQLTTAKEVSPKFEIGTHFWRLLVFPHGNQQSTSFLSVYLEFTEATFTPHFMCPQAQFKLSLLNLKDPSLSVQKDTQHRFTQNETDWGFTQFHSLAEVNDPARGFLVNDTLTIKVEITVQRDERFSYDSRKQTGCVGLKNQGATCYMNSLLQFLYHIPYFRKAVYHMPTQETDDAASSIPLALQGLFYKLQYSKSSVSTKNLTKSFGWNQHDAFMQHDVQEFNRVLCDKLEEKMKGTKVERAINELFEGHISNFIKCVNVDYKSSRKESFMDLQLDVKGCADIYASFDKYTETETLEGDNKYKAEGFGLQDAEKGALFESFPPVLQLQLKRFEYDFQRDALVKINDRYEFYDEIDLDRHDHKYLAPTADRSTPNKYRLHSVLVHSGGVHGGHYYAFIRPTADGGWLKFDDEKVTREDASKAMTEQFGGDSDDANPPAVTGFNSTPALKFTKYSNAYMLVYVRLCDWERVMCPVTKDDIADHLRTRLDVELAEKEQRHKDKQEAHLYCRIKVACDQHMKEQVGKTRYFDLVDSEQVLSLRLKKQTKFSAFKSMIAEQLGVPVEQQRYWTWQRRSNGTERPHSLLPRQDEDVDLMDLREHREKGVSATNKAALMDIRLYLEASPAAPRPAPSSTILVFLKFYDPRTEQLSFLGHTFLNPHDRVAVLTPLVCQLAGLPPTAAAELEAYEEVKLEPTVMVEHLSLDATSLEFEGCSGDIIIFQLRAPSDPSIRHPNAKDFLMYIQTRRTVELRKLEAFQEEGFKLELRSDMSYDEVTQRLAQHLGVADPQLIRLTPHNHYMRHPQRNPVKFRGVETLDHMLQHGSVLNELLYYEVVDLPLPELEQLKTIKLAFYNDRVEQVSQHTVRVPLDKTVGDLLVQLQAQLPPEHQGKELRLLEVMNSRIFKVLPADEPVNQINDSYWAYRAEEGPYVEASGAAAEEGVRFVQVLHVKPPPTGREGAQIPGGFFGDPFLIRLTEQHTPAAIRAEVQAKLNVAEEEFKKWRLVLSHRNQVAEAFEDDDELIFHRFEKASALDQLYIGLEHEDRGPKRPSLAASNRPTYERPVKIYN